MTTKHEIAQWFDRGVSEGATHMIVVCDTFDHEDYPVYVTPSDDVRGTTSSISPSSSTSTRALYGSPVPPSSTGLTDKNQKPPNSNGRTLPTRA